MLRRGMHNLPSFECFKKNLEAVGIYPVARNPDVYIAQTYDQANCLAKLFANDQFVGFDTKLMKPTGNITDSVIPHGCTKPLLTTQELRIEEAIEASFVADKRHLGLPTEHNRRPVSLIQVASHHACVLFQIRRIMLQPPFTFPIHLKHFLSCKSSIKFGVNIVRNMVQIRHSYNVWSYGAKDLAGIAKATNLSLPHPDKIANEGQAPSSHSFEELLYLFKENWELRHTSTSADIWDYDAPHLTANCVRQLADEALARYLVAYKMITLGVLPTVSLHAPVSLTHNDHRTKILALLTEYMSKLIVPDGRTQPIVSINRVLFYLTNKYGPWALLHSCSRRRRLIQQVIIDLVAEGHLRLLNADDPFSCDVELGTISNQTLTSLFIELQTSPELQKRQHVPSTKLDEIPIVTTIPSHLPPSSSSSSSNISSIVQKESLVNHIHSLKTDSLQTRSIKSRARSLVDKLRSELFRRYPQLHTNTASPSATCSLNELMKIVLTSSSDIVSFSDIPAEQEEFVMEVLQCFDNDGWLFHDPLDFSQVALISPIVWSMSPIVSNILSQPVPDAIAVAVHKHLTGCFKHYQAVPRVSLVYKVLHGSKFTAWLFNWYIQQQTLSKNLREYVRERKKLEKLWNLDTECGELLSEWLMNGLLERRLLVASADASGKVCILHDQSLPEPSDTKVEKLQRNRITLGRWHATVLPSLSNAYNNLPKAITGDIASIALTLSKSILHVSELSLNTLPDLINNSTERSTLISYSVLGDARHFTNDECLCYIDGLVRANVLIPTLSRSIYLFNSYSDFVVAAQNRSRVTSSTPSQLFNSQLSTNMNEPSILYDRQAIPLPYTAPTKVMLASIQKRLRTSSDHQFTLQRLRSRIREWITLADPQLTHREDIVEWTLWLMRYHQLIESGPPYRLISTKD